MGVVFVNYRAKDNPLGAAGIHEMLARRFGADRVFRDSVSMAAGDHYPTNLREGLEQADVLVAVIGPRWNELVDEQGVPLIQRDSDWVRREIARAIERGIPIVPILLRDVPDDVKPPDSAILPASIRKLADYQTFDISQKRFGADLNRLADRLIELVPSLSPPAQPSGDPDGAAVFRILGPLALRSREVRALAKVKALLAMLLMSAGTPVTLDQVVSGLWDGDPPTRTRSVVQTYVARVRRLLQESGVEAPLVSQAGGYRLDAPRESIDLHQFRGLVGTAKAEPAAELKVTLLTAALELWGDPLNDIRGPWAEITRNHLETEKLNAELALARAELQLGRRDAVVARLHGLAERHHLNEDVHELLMRALYVSGRRAEALEVYSRVNRVLIDELGIDAGPRLRALRTEIAHRTPLSDGRRDVAENLITVGRVVQYGPVGETTAIRTHRSTPVASSPNTRSLSPPPVSQDIPFVGRGRELQELTAALDPASGTQPPGVILVHGSPGSGKTMLVTRVAHAAQQAGWFPDGTFYANLETADVSDLLSAFLGAFGIQAGERAMEPEHLAASYRALFVGNTERRILIVLDGVDEADQVRPLIPPSETCSVLVTSRRRLPSLDVARSIELSPFTTDAGTEFLHAMLRRAGSTITLTDAETDTILRLSNGLPLALTIIANSLIHQGPHRVGELLDTLVQEPSDQPVEALTAAAYDGLDPGAARLLRGLAMNPTGDISMDLAMALGTDGKAETERHLDLLSRSGLLSRSSISERIQLWAYVRNFVQQRLTETDIAEERRAAGARILDFYLRGARDADLALDPVQGRSAVSADAASAWLATERLNVHAAVRLAVEQDFPAYARDLARSLYWFHATRDDWASLAEITATALDAVVQAGDRAGMALLLSTLADCYAHLDRLSDAAQAYQQALTIHHDLGDQHGEGSVLSNLGGVQETMELHAEAARTYRAALDIFRAFGDLRAECIVLANLGKTYRALSRRGEAVNLYRRAVAGYREIGDRRGEATVLRQLGDVLNEVNRRPEAASVYRSAANAFGELGDDAALSDTLDLLGATLHDLGRDEDAAVTYRRAYDAYRDRHQDRDILPVDELTTYLATAEGHRRWELVIQLAERSPAGDMELAGLLRAHRERPVNREILARLFARLQDLADVEDEVAIEFAGWLSDAERAAPASRPHAAVNLLTGTASGSVVQARDIMGSITFGDRA